MTMINIRKLEAELWEYADLLHAGSKLTSNRYCMPVLGLIFLRYAYSRFKLVEAEILKNRRNDVLWTGKGEIQRAVVPDEYGGV